MPDETNSPPPAPEPQDAAAPSPSEPTAAGQPPEPVPAEPPVAPEPDAVETSAEVAPEAAATAPAAAGDGTDPNAMSQAELDALMAQAGTVAAPAAAPKPAATAGNSLSQEELDALIAQAGDNAPTAPRPKAQPAAAAPPEDPLAAEMAAAIAAEAAAQAAPAAEASGPAVIGEVRVPVPPGDPELFEPASLERPAAAPAAATLDLLEDVHLEVKIELGRAQMYIEDVLRLGAGSVVELDKLAGDPVDIYVNDRLIARGEVLVLNDNFCVRINGIESPIPELARG